ncbi:MAG: 4'-phosphopantetheinyl transferase superfamily protein [Gammaproteobacteria bacterium]
MHDSDLAKIRRAIGALLPAGVATSMGAIADAAAPLASAEQAGAARMSPRRLQEFSAGRLHARQALVQLGQRSPVITADPGRAPRWPAGFVGSISHAGELVVAVAAPVGLLQSVGVDVEPATLLDAELVNRVCRPEEIARFDPSATPSREAKLIFSAKESVYKCVAPLLGIFLEFEDVEILLDAATGQFRARGHGPITNMIGPSTLRGAFAEAGGYWITAAWQGAGAESGCG